MTVTKNREVHEVTYKKSCRPWRSPISNRLALGIQALVFEWVD